MARPHVLSNGQLLIGINRYGQVHDVYFPHVGLENHSLGRGLRHRVGIWVDGRVSWLDSDAWQRDFSAGEYALTGHTHMRNDELDVVVTFDDMVDAEQAAFYRNIHVVNLRDSQRDVRLFMHQAFVIGDGKSHTDTAQYLPDSHAILHYRGRRAFVIGGQHPDGQPFDQFSIGLFGLEGHEGTWRDAEDGQLAGNAVEHGMVDSIMRFTLTLPAHSSQRVYYWLAAGTTVREALTIHKNLQDGSVGGREQATIRWWHNWLKPAEAHLKEIPVAHRRQFIRSLMLIKAHIDHDGAVIASSDTAMLNYSRDAYAYCWPRDSVYALWPLMRLGYDDELRRFFAFMKEVLHPGGYLQHKFRPDGALGSSWHPYVHDNEPAPPIQEDETASVLFLFCQYSDSRDDSQLDDAYYVLFVRKMADFLASYVDVTTGLPKPSYDLWEERFMTSTYTTALVIAALDAAADLADKRTELDDAVRWRSCADDMRVAARSTLYNDDAGCLINGLVPDSTGYKRDTTINLASVYGAFMYGLFDAGSKEITSSLAVMRKQFSASDDRPGMPRYENDAYRRQAGLAPNWWIITTLWTAQHANETGDHQRAQLIVDWVLRRTSQTGTFAEQLSPDDGRSLSVDPLVWSHAEYVSTLLDSEQGASA